jgi:hypothetical protein
MAPLGETMYGVEGSEHAQDIVNLHIHRGMPSQTGHDIETTRREPEPCLLSNSNDICILLSLLLCFALLIQQ